MLVTLDEVLKDARRNKYAVALFDTVTMEMAEAVVQAAENKKSPLIIGSAEMFLKNKSTGAFAEQMLSLIKRSHVPIVLHYDHGVTFEAIVYALRCGFSSVMYDCSSDTLENNIRRCTEMKKIAASFGATLEAELGHVGSGGELTMEGLFQETSKYTDPDQAERFIAETEVDALAVSVGTMHGPYVRKAELQFDLLDSLCEHVKVPLVLHGGSGLSDEDFRGCIDHGISKINIFTDINRIGAESVGDAAGRGCRYLTEIIPYVTDGIRRYAEEKFDLFGCSGKG